MDLGSDGNSAIHFMTYSMALNVDQHPDFSHGANRDQIMMLKTVGLYQLWLLLVVSWNLPHGPDRDDMRFHQLREATEHLFETTTPGSCPLFLGHSHEMVRELRDAGVDFPGEAGVEQELWNYLKKRGFYVTVGSRFNMCRFQSCIATAEDNVGTWLVDWLERTHAAVVLDFLHGKALENKIILMSSAADEVPEGGGSTNPAKVSVQDRTLRSCCQSAVAISVMVSSDFNNRRLVNIDLQSASAVNAWHCHQKKTLRSCKGNVRYFANAVSGGYMQHVCEIVQVLRRKACIEKCDFVLTASYMPADRLINECVTEDDFADYYGQAAMSQAACRIKRGLWLIGGWPSRMRALLGDNAVKAQAVVQAFKKDFELFADLELLDRSKVQSQILTRSVFKKVTVQQYVVGLSSMGWVPDARFKDLVHRRTASGTQTQVVKDSIGTMKNASAVRKCRKFRKPEAGMHAVIKHKVGSERHRFGGLPLDVPLESQSDRLATRCLRSEAVSRSMDFAKIVSTSQKAGWFSPFAQNIMIPFLDLQMARDIAPSFRGIDTAWLGARGLCHPPVGCALACP